MRGTGPAAAGVERPGAPSGDEVESLADELANLPLERRGAARGGLAPRIDRLTRKLERLYRHLAANPEAIQDHLQAASWLLDNRYLVRRVLRQLREDMPPRFYRQLPEVRSGDHAGNPRIYALASELLELGGGAFDPHLLHRLASAYQRRLPLTLAELWALPVMLRLAVLERLAAIAVRLLEPAESPLPEEQVADGIRSLHALDRHPWKEVVEKLSLVDAVLEHDPSGDYRRLDFATRDRYRTAVEEIAWGSKEAETTVARTALELAREAGKREGRGRRRHIGYYLIAEGRPRLEEKLHYRAPAGQRWRRFLLERPAAAYLGGVALTGLLLLLGVWRLALTAGASVGQLLGVCLLAAIPAVITAVNLINWLATHLLPPRVLPKLDFDEGIPADCRTVLVIPALIAGGDEVDALIEQLERHYAGNADPNLYFALLTDFADAPQRTMAGDAALLERLRQGVVRLNERYGFAPGGRFMLFHRERSWNPAEGRWLGWERKRGKLQQFNRLLRGGAPGCFSVCIADLEALRSVRYLLTLDADTLLPSGSAQRLVATLAHPLNTAVFDPESGTLTAGYTVLQPRVEMNPASVGRSRFSRLFSGDPFPDLYSQAVSDIYQDLFGEGIYAGKGIYDIDAFERSLRGRLPENALLSHDLLEGLLGRAGLVNDVVLFEDFPHHYLAYTRRQHRWMRGDWQLLPWLFPRVPREDPGRAANPLPAIARWKILHNLLRSLLAPSLLGLLLLGWSLPPFPPSSWTLLVLLVLAVPSLCRTVDGLSAWRQPGAPTNHLTTLGEDGLRLLLELIFLPYESVVALDAVGRTLWRLLVTRKHLLQWRTAAQTMRALQRRVRRGPLWREMLPAPLLAAGVAALLTLARPAVLPEVAGVLALWLVSPEAAFFLSRPSRQRRPLPSSSQERELRHLMRRTWLFFEHFVGPDDNWLPPDHFQEEPRGAVAHRTSPTNLGLLLLSSLAAHDAGYLGTLELVLRLRETFTTMGRLERYRGHFLNWYDTRTLAPLPPRYVSTVDSGNLLGCLIAVRQGLLELRAAPPWRWQRWQGYLDTLAVLEETLRRSGLVEVTELTARLEDIAERVRARRDEPAAWSSLLERLLEREQPSFDQLFMAALAKGTAGLEAARLADLRTWTDRAHRQLIGMRLERDTYLPWLAACEHLPSGSRVLEGDDILREALGKLRKLPCTPGLDEIPAVCREAGEQLEVLEAHLSKVTSVDASAEELRELRSWCGELREGLAKAVWAAGKLRERLAELAEEVESYLEQTDMSFLFHRQRQVFHIGYDLEAEALDDNSYDLLASEARIASLVAIAKGDVPASHWLHLARPLTRIGTKRVLLSWSATMFEYLMPMLLMRTPAGTLLEQSCRAAVERQIAYAAGRRVPWGISESGFYLLDAAENYQYRAFGVPGLGFKRGLADDLVITPYASLLALPLKAREVLANLTRLLRAGLLGHYGLYEAIDYTASRLPLGRRSAVVKSYMAHHQGMILVSICNALTDRLMVRRFHADPRIKSVELLLYEQTPAGGRLDYPEAPPPAAPPRPALPVLEPWSAPIEAPFPLVHYLSNGRYGLLVTQVGAGYSRWGEIQLTRWRADTTLDDWGQWLYLFDLDSGEFWSATRQPLGAPAEQEEALFFPHKVEFHRRDHGISLRLEVLVSPVDDVEIRRLTLTNLGNAPRRLAVISYGEVVLGSAAEDRRHPAFSKLFVESEYLTEPPGLIFRRRPRSAAEPPAFLAHTLTAPPEAEPEVRFESDRARFLGRGADPRRPAALRGDVPRLSGSSGATLDPIMALSGSVVLEPQGTTQLAFLTLAAASRRQLLELLRRYRSWNRIEQAFEQAEVAVGRELQQLELTSKGVAAAQRLLSLLLYPHHALRAEPEVLTANRQGQSGLWAHGISGDEPILLLEIADDEDDSGLVSELLQAHRYWRNRQLSIDLVLIGGGRGGYRLELQGELRRLVAQSGGEEWLNRRGGIFVLRAEQLSEEQRRLLRTAARVVLDSSRGSLAEQLPLPGPEPQLPRFLPSLSDYPPAPSGGALERPADLLFDNGFGGFTADGEEYLIYLAPGTRTPAPWINVIANPEFGFLVSEAGMGTTWAGNSGEHRLTPWRNDPVSDRPAEALYLRDEETAEVWSATPLPAGAGSPYLVRYGAGYAVFEHRSHGLRQHLRLFAVKDAPVKVIQLRLVNLWRRPRRLTATYYAEWVLGDDRETNQAFIVPDYHGELCALLASNPYRQEFAGRTAFLAAGKRPHGLTSDRGEFLGRQGSMAQPAALQRVGLSGRVEAGRDPCAVLQLHLDLPPGGSEEVFFLLGEGGSREEAERLLERYRHPRQLARAWRELGEFWEELLGRVRVETPEPSMNLLLNRWLLYQTLSCRFWGRSALYQSGGAYGFRDQLQDALALFHSAPQLAREHLLRAAGRQFVEGDVLHWWHPPSGRGVRTRISDDLVWLPFVTAHYLESSGDLGVLEEKVPFLLGAPLEAEEHEHYGRFGPTLEAHSLYQHCLRALERACTAGPHGLPLMGGGDWNDGMNRVGRQGRGESVWLAWFLYATLTRFAVVCDRVGDPEQAARYRERAEVLRQAIERHAWDGEWYLRAFYDDGTPLGSHESRECRLDAISQSWAVLSGAASGERAATAMRAVGERLVREREGLILLLSPPFEQSDHDPGYIRGYPPGVRENGGQYTHAAIWTVWAYAALGDGERAEALFRLLNPILHSDTPEKARRYRLEPYVVAADIYGLPPHLGRGGWSWYTGSAAWLYRLGLEGILGLRRSAGVLELDPCIPRSWRHFTIHYRFGRSRYLIDVDNPRGVNCGVREVALDSRKLPGGRVPLLDDGGKHVVTVLLGYPRGESVRRDE